MNKDVRRFKAIIAAVLIIVIMIGAAVFLDLKGRGSLVLVNGKTGKEFARYPVRVGDGFSIGFIHSVNQSPVTDYYEIRKDGIYVVKVAYYNFGAGVLTELEGNEKLEYGEDGSMTVTGIDRKMDDLVYFVGTVSDHTLVLNEKDSVSLRDLCGRNAMVRFSLDGFG